MRAMAGMQLYLRLFYWFTLRHLNAHRIRFFAVLLGIAIGAAVFTSVRIAINATLSSFSQSMDLFAGTSDLSIVRPGGRLPDRLVTLLLNHSAVKAASPVLSTYVHPMGQEEAFLLIGFDPMLDRHFRSWHAPSRNSNEPPPWAALIDTPYSLLVGKKIADQFNWKPGQNVFLSHLSQGVTFNILGVLDATKLALVEGGRVALCDIATFQEFADLFGRADRIDVLLKPNISANDLASLQALLPAGVEIRQPTERKETGTEMIRAYKYSLTFLSFISLFVGMFLVYSLIAVDVAARRRELAVLQSLGASARLVCFLFMAQGAFIGILGWLLALPISTTMVKYFLAGVSRTVSVLFVRVQVDQLMLSPWELLLSFCVTLAVAIGAALQPAFEAKKIPPREALNILPTSAIKEKTSRSMLLAGLGLLALAWPVSQLPSLPAISLPGYLAALLLFIGFALITPWGLQHLGRLAGPILFRLGGQPAALAAGYLKGSSVQTAISVGALITAVALFSALVIMVHSFRSTVSLWVEQCIAGDLYLRPKLAELNQFRDALPSQVVSTVKGLKEPVTLVPIRLLSLQVKGHPHLFEAMNYADYARRSRFVWKEGNPRQVEADLIAGRGVVVSEVFANSTGLNVGDRYRIRIGKRTLDKPILGIFRDYRTQGGVVYFSLSDYQQEFKDLAWSGVQINFSGEPRDMAPSMARIRSLLAACCTETLEITNGADLRQTVLRIFDETFAITTVLLLIALVVAALGIATTLAVLVLQRSRQLNTLRAVGGSAAQLRNMILWEAGMMVLVGEASGLLCGFILSYLLIFVINIQSFGWSFFYQVDWFTILSALPLIFMTSLLAALPAVKLALGSYPAELLRGDTR